MAIRIVIAATFLLALVAASLLTGPQDIPADQVLSALAGDLDAESTVSRIVRKVRLPRTICALLAGAALGIGGLLMQTLFRNPLAGPGILGVNAGAGLGVALIMLAAPAVGLGALQAFGVGTTASALLGAGVVMGSIVLLSRSVGNLTLLVIGVLMGQFAGSLSSLLINVSDAVQVRRYAGWMLGSFQLFEARHVAVLAGFAISGTVLGAFHLRALDAWGLGEEALRTLGIDPRRVRLHIVAAASLLAGGVTAYCGPIAFLGVAVPHMARGLVGRPDHGLLLPVTALSGAATALVADLASRCSDGVLPINSVLALIGAPVVILVVWKAHRRLERSL